MASTFMRKDSRFIYVRFKDEKGVWQSKPSGYRRDNPGERRQAELLARRMTQSERVQSAAPANEQWIKWADHWLATHYRNQVRTLGLYQHQWRRLYPWLAAQAIHAPRQLRYRHLLEYRDARLAQGVGNNTILLEIKVLRIIMAEAVRREFTETNPCARSGLQRDPPKEKTPWSNEAIEMVNRATKAKPTPQWMRVTFLLGLAQAARLRQCAVPLSDISLERNTITYVNPKGGKAKAFTQPIAKRIVTELAQIIKERQAGGHRTLCDIPTMPSIDWRKFLDALGLKDLCHHGLRVTWCTRAVTDGVAEAEARRFVNHGRAGVHAIYQKLTADDVAHVPDALDLPEL